MFKLGKEKPRICKFVFGFGENAARCTNPVPPDRGPGSTHCWDHKWQEEDNSNKHPGAVSGE